MSSEESDVLQHYSNSYSRSPTLTKSISLAEGGMFLKRLFNNKTQLTVIGAICLVYFVAFGSYALIAPFYTLEAKEKQVNEALTGMIFAIYSLVSFVVSPYIGKLIPIFGTKFTLIGGCFIEGCTEILFGFVSLMPNYNTFVAFSFIIRSFTAFGSSCTLTSALSIVNVLFKEEKSLIFGMMEVFTGIGLMVSPAIGGFLYERGGFKLPFFVYGGITLILLVVLLVLLPNGVGDATSDKDSNGKIETVSIWKTICIPGVFVGALAVAMNAMLITFIEPLLANQLQAVTHNGLSGEDIGLFFLIMPGTYMVASPIVGWSTGKWFKSRSLMIVGLVLSTFMLLILGPAPFLYSFIPRNTTMIATSLAFLGVFISVAFIPCMSDMHSSAIKAGLKYDLATSGVLSGIFGGCFSIGGVIGPTLGSYITEKLAFRWACAIFACLSIFLVFIILSVTIWELQRSKGSQDEREPLLKA